MLALMVGIIKHVIIMPCVSVSVRDSIFVFCKEKNRAFVGGRSLSFGSFRGGSHQVGSILSNVKTEYEK